MHRVHAARATVVVLVVETVDELVEVSVELVIEVDVEVVLTSDAQSKHALHKSK